MSTLRTHRRRAVLGSFIGTTIEWYDFYLYGLAAALVFNVQFFPGQTAFGATLASFATLAVGVVLRPLGGIVAGHFGDRVGRKALLVISLLLMGGASMLIGVLPTFAQAGWWAVAGLVLLRCLQGLSAGMEWGGAALMSVEHAPADRRGLFGSFTQVGSSAGMLLATGAFSLVKLATTDEQFAAFGWRLPFLASGLLVVVGLAIRLGVEDSAEFKVLQERAAKRAAQVGKQAPVFEVVKKGWKRILLGCLMMGGTNAMFYVGIVGSLSYASSDLGMSRDSLLAIMLVISLFNIPVILFSGALSDRVGRKPVVLWSGIGLALSIFPYFALMNTKSLALFAVGSFITSFFQSSIYGPLAAYLGEIFHPKMRYSGMSLAYQLSAIALAGPTPMIMATVIEKTGSTNGIAAYMVLLGVLTAVGAFLLPETNPKEVRDDPNALPGIVDLDDDVAEPAR